MLPQEEVLTHGSGEDLIHEDDLRAAMENAAIRKILVSEGILRKLYEVMDIDSTAMVVHHLCGGSPFCNRSLNGCWHGGRALCQPEGQRGRAVAARLEAREHSYRARRS